LNGAIDDIINDREINIEFIFKEDTNGNKKENKQRQEI
jgi:hypothetical protein